jgi:hypothetical protein
MMLRRLAIGSMSLTQPGPEICIMVVEQGFEARAGLNRGLLAGGVLVGIGSLLGFTGIVLIGSTLLSMTRTRLSQMQPPPKELARLRLRQAKAAVSTARDAWRTESPTGT